jgi:excisionase family DNA binding protein
VSRITIKSEAVVDDACGPEEAANLLGRGIATIWRWIRDDKIIAIKIGGRTLIPRQEIERLKKQDLSDERNG